MAGFQFKFEVLLRHRRNMEDARQRDLAMALRHRMILENQLRSMQQTITDAKHRLGKALVGKVDLAQIAQFARYSSQTSRRAHEIVVKLAEGEREIDHARQALIEAQRDRKAIEMLRDKHYRRWLREQDRRQTVQLDDLAAQAHSRKAAVEAAR